MTVKEKSLYAHLAELLEYPKEDIRLKVEECIKALANYPKYPPEAAEELKTFLKEMQEMPLDDLQGVFSYTFELTSEYTLDIGSYLYEGFKRSNILSSLKSMYRELDFPFDEVAKGELPDHLPILLQFLGTGGGEEMKRNLLETFVILAVEKMSKNFERNRGNVYRHVINAVYKVLDKDVKEVK